MSNQKLFAGFILVLSNLLVGCDDTMHMEVMHNNDSLNSELLVNDESELIDSILPKEEAKEIALRLGVQEDRLIYEDQLPFVVDDESAIMAWGYIEKFGDDDFRVTYIDMFSGELLSLQEQAGENIHNFMEQFHIGDVITWGSSPGSWNSFPWGWRLPMEAGTFTMTNGYAAYHTHTGLDNYATDWDGGSGVGHLLESPASCWVTHAGYAGGYGYQVLAKCDPAGAGLSYGYRVAHMQYSPLVKAGDWINKGTNLGYLGGTGYATAPHVHFVVYRGTISGSSVAGSSVPISQWPSSADSICNKALKGYSFAGYPWTTLTLATTGCP